MSWFGAELCKNWILLFAVSRLCVCVFFGAVHSHGFAPCSLLSSGLLWIVIFRTPNGAVNFSEEQEQDFCMRPNV